MEKKAFLNIYQSSINQFINFYIYIILQVLREYTLSIHIRSLHMQWDDKDDEEEVSFRQLIT